MHILVVNDDGPPSKFSPIVTTFVATLENAGHTISVVLPHVTRSWMGKAHIRNVTVKPEYYVPEGQNANNSPPSRWILANCSPAGCVQLGLFHLFPQLSPVDLVISGPNYGRNVTSISNLCSGTLGAAMEAALCRRKAIALSFSFSKIETLSQDTISTTSKVGVGIIDHLYHHWDQGVELYNVNVPPVHDDQMPKAYYTTPLRNYWQSPSFYERVDSSDKPETNHSELESDPTPERPAEENLPHFQWAPVKTDVQHSIETSPPGTDAWATREGFVSVTPMVADFAHVPGFAGEVKVSTK